MAYSDYSALQANPDNTLSPAQINAAWMDKYGVNAPGQVVNEFSGHVSGQPGADAQAFYNRVSRGDFNEQYYGYKNNQTTPLEAANQLRQFNINANQPAIQALTAGSASLEDRYNKLLDSIKGIGQSALDTQTKATSNEMAMRGILPSSTLFQNQLAGALAPIANQYQNTYAQTGLQENNDLLSLASQIGNLQSGNPAGDISGALSLVNQQMPNYTTLGNQIVKINPATGQAGAVYTNNPLTNSSATGASLGDLWKLFGLG